MLRVLDSQVMPTKRAQSKAWPLPKGLMLTLGLGDAEAEGRPTCNMSLLQQDDNALPVKAPLLL